MAGEETYDPGECTWYVARELSWVRGGWGNAADWVAAARAQGFQIGSQPVAGAVVVYGAGNGMSEFGHVALVRAVYSVSSFEVSEMNFVAWDTVDLRTSGLWDVEGFILPPPGTPALGGGMELSGDGSDYGPSLAGWWSNLADILNNRWGALTGGLSALTDQVRAV